MTNHDDTLLQFCATAEALLAAHANDGQIVGYARTLAQCKFARHAYGALEEACEQMWELAAEVERLRAEMESRKERVSPPPMACGHPRACVVSADDGRDATGYCAWCEDLARWQGLLGVAADNAEGFREMLVECERETVGMKAEISLMKGKANSRGGKL